MGLFNRKKQQTAAAAEPAAAQAPVIEKGIPGEIIAAISAAVACMLGEGFKVTGIRRSVRSGSGKAAWKQAAVAENTRPF